MLRSDRNDKGKASGWIKRAMKGAKKKRKERSQRNWLEQKKEWRRKNAAYPRNGFGDKK